MKTGLIVEGPSVVAGDKECMSAGATSGEENAGDISGYNAGASNF